MTKSDWNYNGLATECYDLWFGAEPFEDQAFFQRKLMAGGGRALEIACGTGRLLILFLRDGLEVEGMDSSQEMLDLCRQKAKPYNLTPVLYQQLMQELDLPRRYATLFIPFCSLQILARRQEAFEALQRFRAHLEPGGQLLVTLFVPGRDLKDEKAWRLRRSGRRPRDGATVLIHEATQSDRLEQLQTQWLRFEVFKDGQLVHSELRTHQLRWYHKHEFEMMFDKVGFSDIFVHGDYTDAAADDQSTVLVFSAKR